MTFKPRSGVQNPLSPSSNYKIEFLPSDLAVTSGQTAKAVEVIESSINSHASQGYDLVQIAQISVLERPGCLASLLGAKSVNVNYNILIFKK